MNPRIEELAGQAFQHAAVSAALTGKGQLNVFSDKFAELIIRECASVIYKRVGPKSSVDVLDHFGLE